jgi:hypothetical protein
MLELRNKCSKEGGDQLQVHRGEPAEQGEHVLCFARNAYTRWSILFVVLFECIFWCFDALISCIIIMYIFNNYFVI